jgi:hypothetical protein
MSVAMVLRSFLGRDEDFSLYLACGRPGAIGIGQAAPLDIVEAIRPPASIAARLDPVLGFAGLVGLAAASCPKPSSGRTRSGRRRLRYHPHRGQRPAGHHIVADREDQVHLLALVEILAQRSQVCVAQRAVVDQLVDRAQDGAVRPPRSSCRLRDSRGSPRSPPASGRRSGRSRHGCAIHRPTSPARRRAG